MATHLDCVDGLESNDVTTANTRDGTMDNAWVKRLRADSPDQQAAIEELRDLLVRGLSKSMSARYGGKLQPDDVVQEALLKILDSLDQFAGRSRFTTWAMTIATRTAISEMRRRHYKDVSIDAFSNEDAMKIDVAVDDSQQVDTKLERQSLLEKLQELIDSELTEKQRFAIRSSLSGMPVEVIAEKSGSNRNSVYKLIHDAKLKLRQGLEKAGIVAEDLTTAFA